jgi:gas vesicle protein
MSDNSGDLGSFLAGLLIGGLMGAAAALLLAPQSGEETRALIKEKSIELRDKASESADEARQRAEYFAQQAQKAAGDLQTSAKQALEQVSKGAKPPAEVPPDAPIAS